MTYISLELIFSGDFSLSHLVKTILTLGSFKCSFGTSFWSTCASDGHFSWEVCDGSSTKSTFFSDIPTAEMSAAFGGDTLQELLVLGYHDRTNICRIQVHVITECFSMTFSQIGSYRFLSHETIDTAFNCMAHKLFSLSMHMRLRHAHALSETLYLSHPYIYIYT